MKTNPIYIPLAKGLLWGTTVVLVLAVALCLDCAHTCAEWGSRGEWMEAMGHVVSACQVLAMIGLSVLGFHGYHRMEN